MSIAGRRGDGIVGNGMAGSRLVTEIRTRDPEVPLTVFGAEAAAGTPWKAS